MSDTQTLSSGRIAFVFEVVFQPWCVQSHRLNLVEQIEVQEMKSGWIVDKMNTEQWRGEL
jgi:hypothetical protein